MQEDVIKQFSIDDIELFRQDDDVDFVHVKLWALAEGNNSHFNPIDFGILERDANTILGKFIIGKFDKWENDSTTHVSDQTILGYVPPNQIVEFEEKDSKRFITVNGVLSKLYATDIVKMFKSGGDSRSVSCEFSCLEGDENEYGDKPILGYHIHGITILGLKFKPSCAGAEIKVMKFAEEFKQDTSLKAFAKERKIKLSKKEKTEIIEVENKEEKMADIGTEEFVEDSKTSVKDGEDKSFETETDIIMSEDEDEKDEPKEEETQSKEEPKKFSLDAYADCGALMALLESETEQNKELAQKVLKEMSAEEIVMTFVETYKELAILKDEKAKEEKEKTDKKLFSIMTPAKEALTMDMFIKLYEEGKALSFSELDGFHNKVKSFVDENKIDVEVDDSIMKFASSDDIQKEQNNIDVFEKISRK